MADPVPACEATSAAQAIELLIEERRRCTELAAENAHYIRYFELRGETAAAQTALRALATDEQCSHLTVALAAATAQTQALGSELFTLRERNAALERACLELQQAATVQAEIREHLIAEKNRLALLALDRTGPPPPRSVDVAVQTESSGSSGRSSRRRGSRRCHHRTPMTRQALAAETQSIADLTAQRNLLLSLVRDLDDTPPSSGAVVGALPSRVQEA
eukprot:c3790_g1_i1.p1 GENE.c3790_g1_i1~~c3790_g1_i1.p1  ORF type:complete len:248 (+),score=34.04 c3790_g1_i1:89-745(+)